MSRRPVLLVALVPTTAYEFGWYDYFPASETYSLAD